MGRYVFPRKIAPSPWGIGSLTYRTYGPLVINQMVSWSIQFFVWVPNVMLYNALSMGHKPPKLPNSLWDFFTTPDEDQATVIGNIYKKNWQR